MIGISKLVSRQRILPVSVLTSKVPHCGFSTEVENIEIPKQIPRGPTDILRALDSTVGRDPTAAHYKYHDDPYLIPLSNNGKRVFAMAQESGRKTAHWVRREHADLFQHREMDPIIECFVPPMVYTENSETSITDLEKLITTAQVSDAMLVYKLLKQKNVEVSKELEQSLLELLCYYNSEDGPSEDFIEERWFRQSQKGKEKMKKTWKDGDIAEQIFINLETKSAEAYCAIIQGMAKYHQVDGAMQLFEEAQSKNIILNTNTFNALLSVVNIVKENFDMRLSLMRDLLRQMRKCNLRPNLGTMNATLFSLSFMGNQEKTKQYSLQILAEFKSLGIEPSLTSWYHLMGIFCKERGPISTILHDIMDILEDKEHQIRDANDVNFFVSAMGICRQHLNDVSLAKRINKLLHYGDNYNLIGDSFKESVYFRHYFALLCANLPMDEFMNDVYYRLVPHIYVPETGIMEETLKQVDANGAVEYVAKLWSDMVCFDHSHKDKLVNILLNTMVNNEELVNLELREKFAKIAWEIFSRDENLDELRKNRLSLTGDIIGKILILLVRNKDFEKACSVMDYLDKNQQHIAGIPSLQSLTSFVDLCIEEKAPSKAITCIRYCADCGFSEANQLAVKLHEKLNLDEVFLSRLSKIVGDVNLAKVSV